MNPYRKARYLLIAGLLLFAPACDDTSRPRSHGEAHDESGHTRGPADDPRAADDHGSSRDHGAADGHTSAHADAVDWCNGHGVPESMCTKCDPSLVERFQREGDWCEEHGFPESVCPVCNPVPPPPGASGPQTRVELTEAAFETSGIRVERLSSRPASPAGVKLPAEVQFDPDRLAHVSPLVDGQIVSVAVTVGDRVEAGDALATFRSVEVGRARAELARANAARRAARANLRRQQRLRADGISSKRSLLEAQQAFDEADAARDAALSHLKVFGIEGGSGSDVALTSPITGVVVERHATRGENVSTDDTLFVIADVSKVWIIGRAYEQHVPLVHVGMGASFSVRAYPGRKWTGTVDYVAQSLDEASRTLPIRMSVDNSDGALRPGMFGTLTTVEEAADGGVSVPTSAVQSLDGRDVVFVQGDTERTFEARPVVLGREAEGRVVILDGLTGTERVVVDGAFILKSELMRGELADGCAGH